MKFKTNGIVMENASYLGKEIATQHKVCLERKLPTAQYSHTARSRKRKDKGSQRAPVCKGNPTRTAASISGEAREARKV